jgi:hypothetical protein
MYAQLQFLAPLSLQQLCEEYLMSLGIKDKRKMVIEHGVEGK